MIATSGGSGSNDGTMVDMNTSDRRYDLDRVVRLLTVVATIVALVWLLRYLSDVLIPFAVGLLIAYLLNPIVNVLEKWLRHRVAAVAVTMLGSLLVAVAGVMVLVPLLGSQLADFRELVTELRAEPAASPDVLPNPTGGEVESPTSLGGRFDAFIAAQKNETVRWALTRAQEFVTSEDFDLEAYVVDLGTRLAPGVWGVVTGALSFLLGLTGLAVVVLYVVFLLIDFKLVEHAWKEHLPPSHRESIVGFLEEFRTAMGRYFRGQFVVAACVGVLFAVGFGLIGLRMGILLGLSIGLLNMVPYLQTLGLLPAALLGILRALENDSSVLASLGLVLLVFVVVQAIQDALLTPRIVGRATGLRPAVILLGVCVWGKLLGFLGLLMAIPLTCLGLAYYRRLVLKWQSVQATDGDAGSRG